MSPLLQCTALYMQSSSRLPHIHYSNLLPLYSFLNPAYHILNTNEGSHCILNYIKFYKAFPPSLDALQCQKNADEGSLYPLPFHPPPSSPSDTSYANLSKVWTSHITKLLSLDTCSWNYTPAFNKPQSFLAMLNSVTSSPSWVWFKWHPHFCNNSLLSYVLHGAGIWQWNVAHPAHLPSWMMHHEATCDLSHKQFSYKLLVIMTSKWSDYSLLKYLEDTGTFGDENTKLCH